MAIRRRASSAVTISGTVDVDLDHTTDSFTLGDETNKMVLQDSSGTKCVPVKIYGAIAGGAAMVDDAAFSIGVDTVTPIGAVYKSSVDTADDGDVGAVHMTATRAMHVYIKGSDLGSGGGTSDIDNSNFTASTSVFTPTGGQYDADESATLADGKMGIVGLTSLRHMKVYDAGVAALLTTQAGYLDGIEGLLTTQAGYLDGIETLITSTNTKLDTLAGYLDGVEGHLDGVEGLLTTIDADTGSMLTALQLIDDCVFVDDAAFTPATSKVLAIGATFDDVATDSVDEGDIGALRMTSTRHLMTAVQSSALPTGASTLAEQQTQSTALSAIQTAVQTLDNAIAGSEMQVDVVGALPAGTNNIGDVDILSIAAGDNNIGNVDIVTMPNVTGAAAHDVAISGNPVPIAARAKNSNPTAVADGDTTYLNADLAGRLVTTKSDRALVVSFTGDIATTTEETMLAAGAAGVFHDLTQLTLTNSHATSAAVVFLRDATAGSTVWQHSIPPNSGMVVTFDPPFNQTTAANNWTIDLVGAVSTIYYSGVAIKRIA